MFVNDVGLKGPTLTYNNAEIAPGIRCYVYGYATTLDRFLMCFIQAGIMASGKELVLATLRLHIIRMIVLKEGWHLEHGLVTKILNWGPLSSVTDVQLFLGTAGIGRKWMRGFSLITKLLTLLTKVEVQQQFFFSKEAEAAQNELKHLVSTAPVLVKLDYEVVKLLLHLNTLPWPSDH